MAKRGGRVHVSETSRHYKGKTYRTVLLRRSYREGGKVRNETVGNLSHLPADAIDAIRTILAGGQLIDPDEGFEVIRSLPHGHVAAALAVLRDLDLERVISRQACRQRDLVVAIVCQLLIGTGSKLSMTRRFSQTTLGEELALGEVSEAELLAAMDWLGDRQDRIEKTLARRHLEPGAFVLYDLSSSYVEGRRCELAALGHNRDGKKGKPQVNWGLVCDPEGRPVSVQVHPGNTADPQTVDQALEKVKHDFGIDKVVLVGDRAMITQARAQDLKDLGDGFVSALKSSQIRKLIDGGDLQLSLFDRQNLAEITSDEFPGERLVVCRNPALAAERARKREELLVATEGELDKVARMVSGPRGSLRNATAAKIGERTGRVINKYKVAKHFELHITDSGFSYQRKHQQIQAEAALDGLYTIRTTCPKTMLTPQAVVRVYKQLKVAERAFRTIKQVLDVRPIRHRLTHRVETHFFLFLLAYYVLFELQVRLEPMLYTDQTPLAPTDPVAPARRSPSALTKAASSQTEDGERAYTLPDLIAELGTICRNTIRINNNTFTRLTTPTELQNKALTLANIKLGK